MPARSLIWSGKTLGQKVALTWSHTTAHAVLIPSSFDKKIVRKEIFCNQNFLHTNIQQGIVITSKGNRFTEFSFCVTQLASTAHNAYRSTGLAGT